MPAPATDELKREIGRLRRVGLTVNQISESLDCSISTASKYQDWAEPEEPTEYPLTTETEGDKKTVKGISPQYIETPEEAIAFAKIDPLVWFVKKIRCNPYQMGFVAKETKCINKQTGETINTRTAGKLQLWSLELTLERILPKPLLDAAEAIYTRFATIAPRTFPEPPESRLGRPVMMALDLFDVHFGKLAWAPECGEDYDLKIAERRFRLAVARLMEHAAPYSVERAVIPIGNDLVHVDTLANTTTNGTPVDTDGRLGKIIDTVFMSLCGMVDYLLPKVGEIDLKYVPGNHDHVTSYFLCRMLKEHYRHCDQVTVDVQPTTRKYVHWGKNLIGYTHGKDFRDPRDLSVVMMRENPQAFADSVCWEWHLGHLHQHRSTERFGVVARILSALSGTDSYHHDRAYVGNRKAAEAYLYDREFGLIGNFIAGGE